MDVSSISSATTSSVQQQQPAVRQAERSSDTESADKIREAQIQAQQTQSQQEAQRSEAQRVEQPKPVVNAQGQKTGSIINTTA
jgi:hypothetical protein